jgi:hypothetical protein
MMTVGFEWIFKESFGIRMESSFIMIVLIFTNVDQYVNFQLDMYFALNCTDISCQKLQSLRGELAVCNMW